MLKGDWWPVSSCGCFTPKEIPGIMESIVWKAGGWMKIRGCHDTVAKKKICACWELNHSHLAMLTEVSLFMHEYRIVVNM
jgi:hypothetical protein